MKWKLFAFTLSELLAVVAIVGIIAALLFPALSKAKGAARATACNGNLRQMGFGLKMYVDDNGSNYPLYAGSAGPAYGDETNRWWGDSASVYWSSKLFPYYPMTWIGSGYRCPSYKGLTRGPATRNNGSRLGSYAYNARGSVVNYSNSTNLLGLGTTPRHKPVSEPEVIVPSLMFAIGESRYLNKKENALPGGAGGTDRLECGIGPRSTAFDPLRHGRNYNQLFCDGHVSAMPPSWLFNPTNTAPMWNNDHQPHPETW